MPDVNLSIQPVTTEKRDNKRKLEIKINGTNYAREESLEDV